MNKIKFYKLVIWGLVALNMAILAYFLMPLKGEHIGPKKVIVEKLSFNKNQTTEFESLIENHKITMRDGMHRVAELKKSLYAQLNLAEQNKTSLDSIKNELNVAKDNLEMLHYNHFLDIKSICTTEQLPKFKELTKEMGMLFGPPGKPKGRRRP